MLIESVGRLGLVVLTTDSWLLVREGTSSMLGTEPGWKSREDMVCVVSSKGVSGCEDRPPILLMPQKGSSSRWPRADGGACAPGFGMAVELVVDSFSAQRLKAL